MSPSPEHIPVVAVFSLWAVGLVASRYWLRRNDHSPEARCRLLRCGAIFLGVALMGLACTLPREPRNWFGLGLIYLSLIAAEQARSRLRSQIEMASYREV